MLSEVEPDDAGIDPIDWRRHPLSPSSQWKRMPFACALCGKRDTQPYRILVKVGRQLAVHEQCAVNPERAIGVHKCANDWCAHLAPREELFCDRCVGLGRPSAVRK